MVSVKSLVSDVRIHASQLRKLRNFTIIASHARTTKEVRIPHVPNSTSKVREAAIPKGIYQAEITKVDEQMGVPTPSYEDPAKMVLQDKLVVYFGLHNADGEPVVTDEGPVVVRKRCNRSVHPKSTFSQLVYDITGSYPGQDYDLDELEGQPCQVYIIHRKDSFGNTWENVDKVMAAES